MSDSRLKDLWQTIKFAVGYYRGDKRSLVSRGVNALFPVLLFLLVVWFVGKQVGFASTADLYRLVGITALVGALDISLVLDFSLLFDYLLGDFLGVVGLRGFLTGLAVLGLKGPVVNYYQAIRQQ